MSDGCALMPQTIAAALLRLGPCSPEALVCYLGIAADEAFAAVVNAELACGSVVYVRPHVGCPYWLALAPWRPCRVPFESFDHLTLWQAGKLQELRAKHPDVFVATGKIARYLECTVEQLRAFVARNPRPVEDGGRLSRH